MSKIDRDSDFAPSPLAQQQRILTRALGCGVEELVAQLGTKTAIKRFESELRRAKRARSRKLYAFWVMTRRRRLRVTRCSGLGRRPFGPPPLPPPCPPPRRQCPFSTYDLSQASASTSIS